MHIHISRNGEIYGPYTPAQIEVLIHAGQIESSDEVWIQSVEWEPVSTLGGFFGALAETPHEAPVADTATLREAQTVAPLTRGAGPGVLMKPPGQTHTADDEEGQENMMRMSFGL